MSQPLIPSRSFAQNCGWQDVYSLQYLDPNISIEKKAGTLGTLFLLDYMYFERDSDMIECRNGKLTITFFNCSCYGCICPCKLEDSSNN